MDTGSPTASSELNAQLELLTKLLGALCKNGIDVLQDGADKLQRPMTFTIEVQPGNNGAVELTLAIEAKN